MHNRRNTDTEYSLCVSPSHSCVMLLRWDEKCDLFPEEISTERITLVGSREENRKQREEKRRDIISHAVKMETKDLFFSDNLYCLFCSFLSGRHSAVLLLLQSKYVSLHQSVTANDRMNKQE